MDLIFWINRSMNRIIDLYDQCGTVYLSFSGGKDSTVVLKLIDMCYERGLIPRGAIPAVFANTHLELDATLDFVNWVKENWYPWTEIIKPAVSFSSVFKNYGYPIISKMKSGELSDLQGQMKNGTVRQFRSFQRLAGIPYVGAHGQQVKINCRLKIADKHLQVLHSEFNIPASDDCCRLMKKKPFEEYAITNCMLGYYTGERLSEGGVRRYVADQRAASGSTNVCTRLHGPYIVKSPIIDWPNEIVDQFIEEYDVPLSRAYTVYGMDRTGCYLCPFGVSVEQRLEVLHKYEPRKYKAAIHFMRDVYIAQGFKLEFDPEYMEEFNRQWNVKYRRMQKEMLEELRPDSRLLKKLKKEERK